MKKITNALLKAFHTDQLGRNFLSGVGCTAVNVVVSVLSYPLYLKFLGFEQYGIWLILTIVLSLAQIGNLGIKPALVKLVAEEFGRDDIRKVRIYMTNSCILLILIGFFIVFVLHVGKSDIVSLFNLSSENSRIVSTFLVPTGILSIFVMLVESLNAGISGLGRMDLSNYMLLINRILTVSLSVIGLRMGFGIKALFTGASLSYLLVCGATLFIFVSITGFFPFILDFRDPSCFKRLLTFGSGMFGTMLLNIIVNPFNKLIITRYIGLSFVPVYEIAFNGSMQIRSLVESGFRAFVPEVSKFSTLYSNEGLRHLKDINERANRIIVLAGFFLYLPLFILCEQLLRMWLGSSFNYILLPVFRLFLGATFFSLLGVPSYYFILGMGKVSYCFIFNLIQTGGNLILLTGLIFSGFDLSVTYVALISLVSVIPSTIYVINRKTMIISSINVQN